MEQGSCRQYPAAIDVQISNSILDATLVSLVCDRERSGIGTELPTDETRASVGDQGKPEAHLIRSSRDGYPAVDWQNLASHHARFVTREVKRHVGDIVRLDQAEQMRGGKLGQRGVSGNQLFDSLGHRR